ncbi:hypothetical protein [Sphingomonas sp.]|uniref:hypothetical protein n=1 Tax=Sphingomonas sp. TaxID=28214 RepID=UPI0025E86949|nr:hypothetical protein [Sphingomonas sp.]
MTLAVDRPAPRLSPLPSPGRDEPISLAFGAVPLALDRPEVQDEYFQATARSYLFRQPKQWAVLVEDGREALFEGGPALSEEQFWYSAVTNAAGVAGYQRGMFPLHGSGVLFPAGMVAFTGRSGAGKTTLTAGLVQRDYPLFADDLCLIRPERGTYLTGRGAPEIRLLRDAAEALGWDHDDSFGHQPARDKFAFVREQSPIDDAPMLAIVELDFADGPPRLERLEGVAPFTALVAGIRLRMGLPSFPRAQRGPAFALVTRMARDIPVYRFTRPRRYEAFAAGLDLLVGAFGR